MGILINNRQKLGMARGSKRKWSTKKLVSYRVQDTMLNVFFSVINNLRKFVEAKFPCFGSSAYFELQQTISLMQWCVILLFFYFIESNKTDRNETRQKCMEKFVLLIVIQELHVCVGYFNATSIQLYFEFGAD